MREVGIGVIGFGTVGAGVVETLQRNGDVIARRTGFRLSLKRIADIDLDSDRGVKVDRAIMTREARDVLADSGVEIVVELMGGTGLARELVTEALRAGKPVVTANKALLAEYGAEVLKAAKAGATEIFFSAAVVGGAPVVRALRRGLVADNIESIHGILNGTCNYILTRMTREGCDFATALAEARRSGYAEADVSLDVDGHDTAHKAAILASLAYGFHVPMNQIDVQGIRGLAADEVAYARELGYAVKLLAVIKCVDREIEVHVGPSLVPEDHMLASAGGVYNAVLVKGDIAGSTLYYGKGAGRLPTAGIVVGDLIDMAGRLVGGGGLPAVAWRQKADGLRDSGERECSHYMRLALLDKPGSLGQICAVLGRNGISIASVMQKDARTGEHVPVVIVTHTAREKQCKAALREIDAMDIVGSPTVRLPIEGLE